MFLLILESLGSTELLFILIMALVFFGPRKLPQLSRSLGKNLAEFRKASEDFKRTWEKEVSLEEFDLTSTSTETRPVVSSQPASDYETAEENSIMDGPSESLQPPIIEAVTPEQVIARHPGAAQPFSSTDETGSTMDQSDLADTSGETRSTSKHNWL